MNSGAAKWTNREVAYFLLRLTFGVNLMMHGLVRILSGIGGFAAGMVKQFAGTPLPPGLLSFFGHLLPWTEAAIGVLILIGLWTIPVLLLGSLEITLLTFGVILKQDWETAGIQLAYALIYAVLIAFAEYNRISIDRALHRMSA